MSEKAKLPVWLLVVLIAMGAAVAQAFGRLAFGILLPAIRDNLLFSNTFAGTLAAANVGAYLLGTLAVAWTTSRFRLLLAFRLGLMLTTAGLVFIAVASSPWMLVVGLVLTGFGGAFVWIPAPIIAADTLPPSQRSIGVALMSSGIGVGVVFCSFLSGHMRSLQGDSAWSDVYQVLAGIALCVLVTSLAVVRHKQGLPSTNAGIGGFSALSRMRGWRPLTLAYTLFGFMYLLVMGFLTTRLEDDSGWAEADAAFAFTIMGMAMVIGGPVCIALANRFGPRQVLSSAFALWAALALVVLLGWWLPTLIAVVGLGFLFSGVPSVITLYVVENTSANDYGPCFAAATLAFGVAQVISPQVGGLLADLSGSFSLLFMLSATVALMGAVTALRLPSR